MQLPLAVLGSLRLVAKQDELKAIHFTDSEGYRFRSVGLPPYWQTQYFRLSEYFDGKRQSFHLPLNPGGSAFQQKVWKALSEIPFGHTLTYPGACEKALETPTACELWDVPTGKTRSQIIIPCPDSDHRC
ncbi:MAG: MGMT family protein [Balneolaceae bacterium]|nr:MGMT family protein [Balneolaceae bacterium]